MVEWILDITGIQATWNLLRNDPYMPIVALVVFVYVIVRALQELEKTTK